MLTEFNDTFKASKLTPRAGIVYQPWQSTSFYFAYAESFIPQFGRNLDREMFVPEEGELFEVGVKQELTDRTKRPNTVRTPQVSW